MFDLIISNGIIVDGTAKPGYKEDIGIVGDKITEIGDLKNAEGKRRLEAKDMAVVPGFIDVHSHGDTGVIINPESESKIQQGITTQIVGNCGSSAFPWKGERLKEARENLAKYNLEADWDSIEGYFQKMEHAKPAINTATFIGQGTLRASIMGEKDIRPDESDMNAMKKEVVHAMEEGALGVSTGLIYSPGFFADQNELTELMKASAEKEGLYASHVRGEGDTLLEAIQEALEIGQNAACGVQVSHLKASGPRNWGKVSKAIRMIEDMESNGMDISWDKYPYTAGSTDLASYLPRWAQAEGTDALMKTLQDPQTRSRIFKESDRHNEGEKKWDSVIIIGAESDEYKPYEGKSVREIAELTNKSLEDTFCDLLHLSRAKTDVVCFTQSQEETDLALTHRLGLVCTDSGVWSPYGPLSRIKPHPRAYGTFPRFFKYYVKDQKSLSLEEAVSKATAKSAKRFRLAKRGEIQKGYYADLVIL
ncbi:amidohydrolase family protein, partial [Candidatus Sumerlaeota bacterium]|nr:amidohydrolase family protein [Candidatus Sumerlaeota bacterium]